MIGSFLTSGLVMVFGYAYPAFECFKIVEKNKPDVEQLRFWCKYWILVAMLAVFERIGDIFISWLPFYCEGKLALYIYLWYPKTMGTTYVYDSFLKPYVEKHEKDIDRNLMELRTRAGDIAVFHFSKVATYGQAKVFEILQFVASQRPYQNQGTRDAPKPTVATSRQVVEDPPSPASSTSSSQDEAEVAPVVRKRAVKLTSAPAKPIQPKLKKSTKPEETIEITSEDEANPEQTDPAPSTSQDTQMEDTIRLTRGRLRKSGSVANKDA